MMMKKKRMIQITIMNKTVLQLMTKMKTTMIMIMKIKEKAKKRKKNTKNIKNTEKEVIVWKNQMKMIWI